MSGLYSIWCVHCEHVYRSLFDLAYFRNPHVVQAERDVWRDKIKDLSITAVNGSHRAEYDAFTDPGFKLEDIANCAPAADHVQRFRWKRYWAEVEFVQHKEAYGERPPAQLKLRWAPI